MPPEMRRATRSPRSSSGTGVGSRGMEVQLSYAPPGAFDDRVDLGRGPFHVVVGHHVVVVRGAGHLALGDLAPRGEVLRGFAAALDLPPLTLLLRRRHDEDGDRIGNEAADLVRALDVDLQHDVASGMARILDAVAEGAVEIAVVCGVLEKRAFPHQVLELVPREEGVVVIRLFVRPRLARGARDGIDQVAVQLEEPLDHRVLPHARRAGDHDEKASLHLTDAQKSWKSAGGPASKLISVPLRGCRRRSRHAWSMGRWAPGSRPPYSASPATGWPSTARWTRIWCMRPVSRSQRKSVWVCLFST